MQGSVGYAEGVRVTVEYPPLGNFSFHWAHVSVASGFPENDRKKIIITR